MPSLTIIHDTGPTGWENTILARLPVGSVAAALQLRYI